MNLNKYIVFFIVFAFAGWIWESIYCSYNARKWANRGFLYGPICPIYGFGGVIGLIAYDLAVAGILPQMNWWQMFIAGFIVSMILEYPTSYVLEKCFGARWWDYSDVPLNLNGRTSVPTSIAFGAAAILVMKVILPALDTAAYYIPDLVMNILAILLTAAISVDMTLTISALTDFEKRVTAIDDAFQKHMIDVVENMVERQNALSISAASRIRQIRYAGNRANIAQRLREGKLGELIEKHKSES